MNLADTVKNCRGLVPKLARLGENPVPETPVLFAKVKLLWKCNLSCSFCNAFRRHEEGSVMKSSTAAKILTSLKGEGLRKVHLSGGEVFLHPEIREIIGSASALGLQVNLTSNGTLITGDTARFLAGERLHSISISLDSSSPGLHDKLRNKKGAFRAAMKGIGNILKHRKKYPRLRINTVATSRNFHDLDSIHELIGRIDREIKWKIIPVDTAKKKLLLSKEQFKELVTRAESWPLLEEMPRRPDKGMWGAMSKGMYAGGYYRTHICYMPWIHLFVDPAGMAYPCCMARGSMEPLGSLASMSPRMLMQGAAVHGMKGGMAARRPFEICHSCDDFIRENIMLERLIEEEDLKGGSTDPADKSATGTQGRGEG